LLVVRLRRWLNQHPQASTKAQQNQQLHSRPPPLRRNIAHILIREVPRGLAARLAARQARKNTSSAILRRKAGTTDYPGILSDVLDRILSMIETNWENLCEKLAELLCPILASSSHLNSAQPASIHRS